MTDWNCTGIVVNTSAIQFTYLFLNFSMKSVFYFILYYFNELI